MKEVKAYVLVTLRTGGDEAIVGQLNQIGGITVAHYVTGPYDVIAFVEVDTIDDLRILVKSKIHKLENVIKTITCVVF